MSTKQPAISLLYGFVVNVISALRPYAPQLVPILVFAFFVPLAILLSAFAGYIVWTNLSVSWESPLHFQYGDGVPPYAQLIIPSLVPTQRYDVAVNLLLPASQSNLALGNFMTTLTLSTLANKTIASVRRPAIAVASRSAFFFTSSNLVRLQIPLLSSFVAGSSSLAATVEVGRRDGWTSLAEGQGRELSVLSASLQGLAVPHGVRGLAIRFPLTASLLAAFLFLAILALILGSCTLPSVIRISLQQLDNAKTYPRIKSEPLRPIPEVKPTRRRRKSRSSRSSSERRKVKTEAPSITIPPSTAGATDRLRRRPSSSKGTDGFSDSDS